ncbi:hypothetical protein [Chitinophaga vietnamensis]|uniref:hypothetical protein n=1 Tax=Chitinophaga vietnamensis TaxID=2593957 RepID=UPI001177CDA2|nr:hypothetical protein [Chitinophaga vietnamensis]
MRPLIPSLHRPVFVFLLLLTLLSRFIVRYFFHITFDAAHVHMGWQLLSPELLQHRLLQSLWYLHSQPPLFNLLTGLALKCFPVHYALALEYLFMLMGFLQTWLLYRSLYELCTRRWLAAAIAAYCCISPAFLLYESWYFYAMMAMCGLSWSMWCLIRYLQTEKFVWACALFGLLAMLSLTVSMFHLGWILLVVLLLCFLQKALWRKTLLAAIFPLLVVAGWYGKNDYLFGEFTGSTWMGMNISRIMLPVSKSAPLAVKDDTTRHIAAIGPFHCVSDYAPWLPADARYPDIPALHEATKPDGTCNLNHLQCIWIAQRFKAASLAELKAHPRNYASLVMTAHALYFAPASEYFHLAANRNKIAGYTKLFNLGQHPIYKNYVFVSSAVLALLYALAFSVLALQLYRRRKSATGWHWQETAVSYAAFNILFFLLIGNLLELGENMRFRFQVIPLFLFVLLYLLYKFKKQPTIH